MTNIVAIPIYFDCCSTSLMPNIHFNKKQVSPGTIIDKKGGRHLSSLQQMIIKKEKKIDIQTMVSLLTRQRQETRLNEG